MFVASEAVPFAKTGGLADVVGALPIALTRLGHEVTLVLPCYRSCRKFLQLPSVRAGFQVQVGPRSVRGTLKEAASPADGVRVLMVDQPEFFNRSGFYVDEKGRDYPDNCERFAFLSQAAFAAAREFDLAIDCIHAHDWHTGLVPVYLKRNVAHEPRFRHCASVFSIHNIAFQGNFEAKQFAATNLDAELYRPNDLEFFGRFSFMKGGIIFSDIVSTVSRNYAKEILGDEFGNGMQNVLRPRADRLSGIVNGIDYHEWNPATDPSLPANFTATHWQEGKRKCRAALRQQVGLAQRDDLPLVGMVSRLTNQKGFDLLAEIMNELMQYPLQLVVLGTGDAGHEGRFERLSKLLPGRFAVRLAFDEKLARQIYAGADMFLMPSRFEPCGLSQLYSLRYGTVPIVRSVGGLVDTVVDASPKALDAGAASGIQFQHYTPEALLAAIRRALRLYAEPTLWSAIVEAGMTQDWSWDRSALQYVELYNRAIFLSGAVPA